ncbi:MAG: ornithine cyclodeaminase family protein [Halobacteriales archaeon]
MVRVLSEADVSGLLDREALLAVVEDAFLAQGAGAVERPERPHFPVGTGLDPDAPDAALGTGLVMPAYVHGAEHYATKLVGVHEANADRGLPTVQAQVVLTEAETGRPAAFLAGTTLTNARTGAIGGVAVRALRNGPVRLGLLGAGTQARWQARTIDAAVGLDAVRIYSPSDSRTRCAADLRHELDVDATPVGSPREAVTGANVVVTATTAAEPVFPGDALAHGAVVVAVGAYTAEMQELDAETMARAGRVYADVPAEVATVGDVVETGVEPDELVPLSALLAEDDAPLAGDTVVVESVGSAVLDAAVAEHVLERAAAADRGSVVELEGTGGR